LQEDRSIENNNEEFSKNESFELNVEDHVVGESRERYIGGIVCFNVG